MAKKIVLLGATGSIGTQALSLLKDNSEYELVGITANKNVDKLVEIVKEFPTIKFVGIVADSKAKALKEALPEVEVLSGKSINLTIIDEANPDVVLNSILGFDGFLPSLHALKKDKILLLANKETLVVGGNFINEVLAQGHGKLIPIDSEHVAVAKCLAEVPQDKKVKELFITASGGALRDYPTKAIGTAPIQAVLAHPTWKMGPKITVDSATMVNKAYEVIEASMLFHYPLKDIKAVINRESLIHGGVVLEDGTSIYEYSPNTMLTPIKYALSLGTEKRHELTDEDKEAVKNLKTEDIDKNRYPMFTFILSLVGKYPSRAAIVVNAVDEEAVNAYLNGEIRFGDVETILRKVSSSVTRDSDNPKELKDVLDLDEKARDAADKIITLYANALKAGNNPSDIVAKPIRDANRKHEEEIKDEVEKKKAKKASRWKNDPKKKALLKEHEAEKAKKEKQGYPRNAKDAVKEKKVYVKREDKKIDDRKKDVQSFGDYMDKKKDDHQDFGRSGIRGKRPYRNTHEVNTFHKKSDHYDHEKKFNGDHKDRDDRHSKFGGHSFHKSNGGFHSRSNDSYKPSGEFHKSYRTHSEGDNKEKKSYSSKKPSFGHSSFKGGERHLSYRGKSSFGGDKKPSYRGGHFDKARQDKPQGATKKRTFHTGRKNFNRGR